MGAYGLGKLSILSLVQGPHIVLYGQSGDDGLSIRVRNARRVGSLEVSQTWEEVINDASRLTSSRLCLFKVDMAGDSNLQAIISFQCVAGRKYVFPGSTCTMFPKSQYTSWKA